MDDRPLFQNTDEYERTYAPQQLPPGRPAQARVQVEGDNEDEGGGSATLPEAPSAAPVGTTGTSPSALAAPPNIGRNDGVGGQGDPDTQARYPMDTDETTGKLR